MKVRLLLVGLLVAASGCAVERQGYVYSPTQPGRGAIVLHNSMRNRGEAELTLADGEHCLGRFSTVPGRLGWVEPDVDLKPPELTQSGMAVFACSDSHLVRCGFSRATGGAGIGRCVDNRGEVLTMYF